MNELFGFLGMAGNHEDRCVARYDDEDTKLSISTAAVNDSDDPFETAVSHPLYNAGAWAIVATYPTGEEAEAGHKKWMQTMTAEVLPSELIDVSTCGSAAMLRAIGDEMASKRTSILPSLDEAIEEEA